MIRLVQRTIAHLLTLLGPILLISCGNDGSMTKLDNSSEPPTARKVTRELTNHGHTRVDHYYWLRDDKRQDPDVLAYLNAENEYTKKLLSPFNR